MHKQMANMLMKSCFIWFLFKRTTSSGNASDEIKMYLNAPVESIAVHTQPPLEGAGRRVAMRRNRDGKEPSEEQEEE